MANTLDLSIPNEERSVDEWNESEDWDITYVRDQAYLVMKQDSSRMLVMDTSVSDNAMALMRRR
jgi:hypothetical protein